MPLKLEDKQSIVAAVNSVASSALSAVVADYRGLSVSQMTTLRKQARDQGVFLKVVRNTLARRAVEGTEYECLKDSLIGPTVIAFSQADPGAAARLLKEFSKGNDKLVVKALSVGGKVYGAKDIDVLATQPKIKRFLSLCLLSKARSPNLPARSTKCLASWYVRSQRSKTQKTPLNLNAVRPY